MRSALFISGVLLAAALTCGCESDPTINRAEPPPPPANPSELIEVFEKAYGRMDLAFYQSLLPEDADAPFLYIFSAAAPGESPYWDRDEELRIHRRMFESASTPAGEPPVPQELHLKGITIALTPNGDWRERPDLYTSPDDSTGLDPARWRATEAQYVANVFWDTQSSVDFAIDSQENFIVIEDLTRPAGESRKFLLYRWEDLSGFAPLASQEAKSWSSVKSLYRR